MQKLQKRQKKTFTYLIGIDEVGRGPLAGPVAVCASMIKFEAERKLSQRLRNRFSKKDLPALRDSKKLTENGRDEWLKHLVKDGNVTFSLSYASAVEIDKRGIAVCIKSLVNTNLSNLKKKANFKYEDVLVLLDGGLKAPKEYLHQETIVKGDDKEPIISFASIYAKVKRDGLMKRLAVVFPQYGFDQHKGYGTKAHISAIKKHRATIQHRRSFLKNVSY